jgi:prophage regulatory protein
MPQGAPRGKRFIRLPEVCKITSLSVSTIYDAMRSHDFPKPVKLFPGPRVKKSAVAWVEDEVLAWMDARMAERDERRTPPKTPAEAPEPPIEEEAASVEAKPPAPSHKERVLRDLARKAAAKREAKPRTPNPESALAE